MSEKDYSDEKCAAGLKDPNECAPSHPEEMSFAEENQLHAGVYAHPLPTPSSVTFLPSFDTAACCPSTVVPLRYPDDRMGVHMRGSNPGSFPWMTPSRFSLSLRPETPLIASACAMTGEEKKNSSEVASELCAALDRTTLDLPKPLHPCTTGKMEEGARSTTADGFYRKYSDYPNNCNTTENEAKSEASAADDEHSLGDVISLQENSPGSPGSSREIMAASAVNMSSVQDILDLWSCPPEYNAMSVDQDCPVGDRRKVKLNNCNPPVPGDISPFSDWDEQFEIGFLNALFSDAPNPLDSAQPNLAVAGHAYPSNAGQSAEDGDNLRWASCKICWLRLWKFIFIPCGHGTCKPCYRQLINQMCPFCRKHIREIVEVRLEYRLEAASW